MLATATAMTCVPAMMTAAMTSVMNAVHFHFAHQHLMISVRMHCLLTASRQDPHFLQHPTMWEPVALRILLPVCGTLCLASVVQATVDTCSSSSNFDTKISVFQGSCGVLTCVDGNDDDFSCSLNGLYSSVTWTATASEQYFVLVHGFSSCNWCIWTQCCSSRRSRNTLY